jgi:hypothetical protein
MNEIHIIEADVVCLSIVLESRYIEYLLSYKSTSNHGLQHSTLSICKSSQNKQSN